MSHSPFLKGHVECFVVSEGCDQLLKRNIFFAQHFDEALAEEMRKFGITAGAKGLRYDTKPMLTLLNTVIPLQVIDFSVSFLNPTRRCSRYSKRIQSCWWALSPAQLFRSCRIITGRQSSCIYTPPFFVRVYRV